MMPMIGLIAAVLAAPSAHASVVPLADTTFPTINHSIVSPVVQSLLLSTPVAPTQDGSLSSISDSPARPTSNQTNTAINDTPVTQTIIPVNTATSSSTWPDQNTVILATSDNNGLNETMDVAKGATYPTFATLAPRTLYSEKNTEQYSNLLLPLAIGVVGSLAVATTSLYLINRHHFKSGVYENE